MTDKTKADGSRWLNGLNNILSIEKTLPDYKFIALGLAFLGIITLLYWFTSNNGSTTSLLILLSGLSMISISILLYFLSPYRYLRNEVSDAMSISNLMFIGNIISSMSIDSNGVYVLNKDGERKNTEIFLSLANGSEDIVSTIFNDNYKDVNIGGVNKKGLSLVPPGYGLYLYAEKMGYKPGLASMESDIKDMVQNNLELASNVTVKKVNNRVIVKMQKVADQYSCNILRRSYPEFCAQYGCPICSLVGCMVVNSLDENVKIESLMVNGDSISMIFKVVKEPSS